jgi:hypothetical protein
MTGPIQGHRKHFLVELLGLFEVVGMYFLLRYLAHSRPLTELLSGIFGPTRGHRSAAVLLPFGHCYPIDNVPRKRTWAHTYSSSNISFGPYDVFAPQPYWAHLGSTETIDIF